jgi:AraC family transcriptional activator of mtrCDE
LGISIPNSQNATMDWLSRLFDIMPVRGRLDLRCAYRAPWRIDQGPGEPNEIPYHAVVSGSALLEDPAGGRPLQLKAGDIVLLPGNPRHVMHDGSGARAKPMVRRPGYLRSSAIHGWHRRVTGLPTNDEQYP